MVGMAANEILFIFNQGCSAAKFDLSPERRHGTDPPPALFEDAGGF